MSNSADKARKHKKLLSKYFKSTSKVNLDSNGPTVKFKYKRVEYTFKPKLKVNRSWVEIKPINSFCTYWQKNALKAKACEKQAKKLKGISFKFLVFKGKKVYVLPKNWYKLDLRAIKKKVLNYPDSICILALDPGVTNAAWAVLNVKRKPFTVNIIASGMLSNTIKSLKDDMLKESKKFLKEIKTLIDEYNVNSVILERFMTRGNLGTTIELVNVMIGTLVSLSPVVKRINLITAAQWKNECNKHIDLSLTYKQLTCTTHQVDACFIGLYGACAWFDEKPYFNLSKTKAKFLAQVEQSNLGQVFKRRAKR